MKASTLAEALVAGSVFMTVFLISINTATAIMSVPDIKDRLETEQTLEACIENFRKDKGLWPNRTAEYGFGWGKVSVSTEPYTDEILVLTVAAKTNAGWGISYRMLYPIENE